MKKLLTLIVGCIFAFAAQAELTIATGTKGKGFSAVYDDIAKVCGSEVKLTQLVTSGGLDNLNALSTNEADLGFSQLDIWQVMKNGDPNIASLKGVLPLNFSYLHVLVSTTGYNVTVQKTVMGINTGTETKKAFVSKFTELRGKTVGLVGSAQLLGRRLNASYGYNMKIVDLANDKAGVAALQKGEIAAMFTLSGWPMPLLQELNDRSGVTLAAFDAPSQPPYMVRPLNYRTLGVYNSPTLGIRNVLFSRPYRGEKVAEVNKLRSCLQKNLVNLQEGKFTPGWKEINDFDSEMPQGVTVFK